MGLCLFALPNSYCGETEIDNLCLNLHRAYNSALGRWISRDPIEEAGGVNLYDYVGNEPVTLSDPSGLDCTRNCILEFLGLSGLGGGLVAGGQQTITKRFSSGGATKGTSILSSKLGRLGRRPYKIPTPVGFPPVMRSTPYIGRAFARWAPALGVGVTAYSIYELLNCLSKCPPPPQYVGDYDPPDIQVPSVFGRANDSSKTTEQKGVPKCKIWNAELVPKI